MTKLTQFGPWKEITREQAAAAPPTHVLSVVEGDDGDEWFASAGFHFVNVLMYFRSTLPMPDDLFVEDVWLNEDGAPVAAAE
jgi:hypothetical protein